MLRINVLGCAPLRALQVALFAVVLSAAAALPAKADGRYASIVVDVQSGKTLYSKSSDERRYPASLTKIMTLYLLFEDLEAGRVRLNTPFGVSARAAAQAPSKLGLRPGSSIRAGDAIQALVTKSANDVAVVVAEALAGSEEAFARRMTAKARALGMASTTFRNASGLPDSGQVTTARDLALLGVAIQQHFPQQYRYFSTRVFNFGRRSYGNHNKLLGRVAGVDGIKTGYTNASGFNLVTSVRRDGRHLIAVVLGGASGRARDAHMQGLVTAYLPKASPTRTTPVYIAKAPREIGAGRAVVASVAAPAATPREAPAALEPAPIVSLPTPVVVSPPTPVVSLPAPPPALPAPAPAARPAPVEIAALSPPQPLTPIASAAPLADPDVEAVEFSIPSNPKPMTLDAQAAALSRGKATGSAKRAEKVVEQGDAEDRAPAVTVGSWIIQIGAVPSEAGAEALLSQAQAKAKRQLATAAPMTERVGEGDKSLYRARFAGLSRDAAASACQILKKNSFACFATQN